MRVDLCVMTFESRQDAGHRLGEFLKGRLPQTDLVLGLPRGGVIVAAEVAHSLGVPLDVLMVRKIGHPLHREFAVGAMAEGGVVRLDESSARLNAVTRSALDEIILEETIRLKQYEVRFRGSRALDCSDRSVLVVDDGLATGATTEVAVLAAKRKGARQVCVAVPVASTSAVERLLRVADDVLALVVDPDFAAVGVYYDSFPQTTDDEVVAALSAQASFYR